MKRISFVALFILTVAIALPASRLCAQQPLPAAPRKPTLGLGVAWYPEQWPESRWDADLSLMQAAHIRFVRIGEFAWSAMEPSEGNYKLDWLERAVRAAEKHDIAVVMGTPTAAPPAWLTQKYPQTLLIHQDGSRDEHGNRQQFDFGDPKYRELARDIVTQLAVRFGHDPNVIGWQIDNEYSHESFSADTRARFQDWLHTRYGTLDNLNARWTASYWSETYSAWNQIPIEENQRGNPGLLLTWKEFVSDTWRSYQRNQLDVIRAHADPRQFITTNTMGWFNAYDHYTVTQDLDMAAWDNYVGSGHLDPFNNGAMQDLVRGFRRQNFWVMETQPGFVNWSAQNNALDRGEARAMAWNAIGHGAEAVAYWQWRSALNGQEQYHGTLVGPDGTPVPFYAEVAEVGADFERADSALAGTTVHADVAVLYDYNSRWAVIWQQHSKEFDYLKSLIAYYRPLHDIVRSVDIVSDTTPLSSYKLVIAPALNLLTPAAATNLESYVRGGGHLVLTARSGMKDEDNALYPQRQPGPLVSLLGARVEQYYALDKPVPFSGEWGDGQSSVWAEQLGSLASDVQVLSRYGKSNGWLDGQPAVVTRKVGSGRITYIGATLDAAATRRAAQWLLHDAGVAPVLQEIPEGVDVAIRSGSGKRILILTNYASETRTVKLTAPMEDVLHGGTVASIELAQYGVAVLRAQ